MRRKLVILVCFVVLVLAVTVVVRDEMQSHDPPFPVGMPIDEVQEYEQPGFLASGGHWSGSGFLDVEDMDWLGKRRTIHVVFENSCVVHSEVIYSARTKPPWLEKLLTRIGW